MKHNAIFMAILIIPLILTLTFISGCTQKIPTEKDQVTPDTGEKETPDISETPYLPITTSLSISKPPALGQTAELTVTFSTIRFNVSNMSILIELPEGLEYVSGDLSWRGDVVDGESVQFSVVVKAVKTGTWLVMVRGMTTARGFGYDDLYLLISEDSAQVSKEPFPDLTKPKRRYAVSMNDSEIPLQPPSNLSGNFSGAPEEPASPDQINP